MPSKRPKRITIIPTLHGKVTGDGKTSEPDIYWILDKWLERHPEAKGREQDIRIARSYTRLRNGAPTDYVTVSILFSDDLAGYDPSQDIDLYEYYLADDQDDEAGQAS